MATVDISKIEPGKISSPCFSNAAHTLPGRTCRPHPKPIKECAQFGVSGEIGNEKSPTAPLLIKIGVN